MAAGNYKTGSDARRPSTVVTAGGNKVVSCDEASKGHDGGKMGLIGGQCMPHCGQQPLGPGAMPLGRFVFRGGVTLGERVLEIGVDRGGAGRQDGVHHLHRSREVQSRWCVAAGTVGVEEHALLLTTLAAIYVLLGAWVLARSQSLGALSLL